VIFQDIVGSAVLFVLFAIVIIIMGISTFIGVMLRQEEVYVGQMR
jgi:hypothetical protein